MVYGFYNIGFHWSLQHFLDDILFLMADRAVATFTVTEPFQPFSALDQVTYQLISKQIFGTSCGHMIGVDVIELVVGTEPETSGDGDETAFPQRFEERSVQASEIPDKTETARDFVVNEGLCAKSLCVGCGNPNGWLAGSRNGSGKLLDRAVLTATGQEPPGR